MSINIETLKPNLFDKLKICSEPLQQNKDEIVKRKSLVYRQTKICARAIEKHQNSKTNETTMLVRKKFDRSTGNMTEQTSIDYKSCLSTTETWPSSNGAKEPSAIKEKFLEPLPEI
jgi:hypothetical protein